MVLVDTSVWIDYFAARENEQTLWLRRVLGSTPIGTVDLVLCEVLQGTRTEASFERARHRLALFPVVDSGGEALAIASARNYRALRDKGYTVRTTVDCLIATVCLAEGCSLLHRDRDFDSFERHLGLRVVHP